MVREPLIHLMLNGNLHAFCFRILQLYYICQTFIFHLKFPWIWLIVTSIILIFLYQNYLFILSDRATGYSDKQLLYSLSYYSYFVSGDMFANPASIPYPPLIHLISALCFKIFGLSMEVSRNFISFFSVIFLLSMFGIGKELGDDYSGLCTMALAASSPHILNNSRLYFLDFPQTAMTSLSFWLLLKSRNFRRLDFSICFVVTLTLSFLIKWSTAFFIFIPLLWIVLSILLSEKKAVKLSFAFSAALALMVGVQLLSWLRFARLHSSGGFFLHYVGIILVPCILFLILFRIAGKKIRKFYPDLFMEMKESGFNNFIYCSLLFLILVMPWYFFAAAPVLKLLLFNSSALAGQGTSIVQNLTIITAMFNYAPIYIGIGIIYLFRSKHHHCHILLLLANIIFLSVLSFKISFPAPRYILSLVIFMAALGGYWVACSGKLKPFITGFTIVISLMSFLVWTGLPMNCKVFLRVSRLTPEPEMIGRILSPRLFCSDSPYCSTCTFIRMIDLMKATDGNARPVPVVYVNQDEPGTPFALENVALSAREAGKRIEPIPLYLNYKSTILPCLERMKKEYPRSFPDTKEILIVHRSIENMDDVLEDIRLFFSGKPIQKEDLPVCENWHVTVVQLYSDDN